MSDLILKEIKPDDPGYYKPLDELIEDLGHAEPAKQYGDVIIQVEDLTDALYYLRMYRSDMQMYANNQKLWEDELKQKIKDFGDAKDRYIKRLKELEIGTLNNPLTWDELKQMEGKPVWVEHKHYSKWLIVYEVYENTIVLDGNGYYTQYFSDDNDKEVRWKAYRKKRG